MRRAQTPQHLQQLGTFVIALLNLAKLINDVWVLPKFSSAVYVESELIVDRLNVSTGKMDMVISFMI